MRDETVGKNRIRMLRKRKRKQQGAREVFKIRLPPDQTTQIICHNPGEGNMKRKK
jgi:hypothetical protein